MGQWKINLNTWLDIVTYTCIVTQIDAETYFYPLRILKFQSIILLTDLLFSLLDRMITQKNLGGSNKHGKHRFSCILYEFYELQTEITEFEGITIFQFSPHSSTLPYAES